MDISNKNWWEKPPIKVEYRTCNICMNEMKLVKSTNGDYWICKVCNNIENF